MATAEQWDAAWVDRLRKIVQGWGLWQLDRHLAEGEGTGVNWGDVPPQPVTAPRSEPPPTPSAESRRS